MEACTPEWLRPTRRQLEAGQAGARGEIASERQAALFDTRSAVLFSGFSPGACRPGVEGRPVQAGSGEHPPSQDTTNEGQVQR